MKITVELEQEDYNDMHDVIYGVTDVEPTDREIQAIWDELPHHIKSTAIEWGCSDTVFRDNLHKYLTDKLNGK